MGLARLNANLGCGVGGAVAERGGILTATPDITVAVVPVAGGHSHPVLNLTSRVSLQLLAQDLSPVSPTCPHLLVRTILEEMALQEEQRLSAIALASPGFHPTTSGVAPEEPIIDVNLEQGPPNAYAGPVLRYRIKPLRPPLHANTTKHNYTCVYYDPRGSITFSMVFRWFQ